MEIFSVPGNNTKGEVAFVIAGVYGSELSGIEVARWLFVKLTEQYEKNIQPYYHTLIIPELYPDSAKLARMRNQDLQTKDPMLAKKAQYIENNTNWSGN